MADDDDTGVSDWLHKKDKLFFAELEKGQRYAKLVVERLVAEGIPARLTEMEIRRTVDDRHRFRLNEVGIVETSSRRSSSNQSPAT